MRADRILRISGLIILAVSLIALISACGGNKSGSTASGSDSDESTDSGSMDTGHGTSDDNGDTEEPTPTPELAELFPDVIVLHPDAYDLEVTEASGTYVYLVPMMVQEATDYLLAEHEALGWEKLGNPTVMGHLATLTMKMGEDRLTVSMQDNELSESTRVQIVLIQQ